MGLDPEETAWPDIDNLISISGMWVKGRIQTSFFIKYKQYFMQAIADSSLNS